MVSFTSTKIFLDSETVAEQLRGARQAKNLKLKDVAQKLNINYKYLEALEKGDLEKLPKGVYSKNFLKEYAIFLGLDQSELIKIFEEDLNIAKKQEKEKGLFASQVAKNRYFWAMPKIVKNIIITAATVVCLFYLGYRLNKIVSPPQLTVSNPGENVITHEKSIKVDGNTEAETQIIINGEQVLSNSAGYFSKKIGLKSGINAITVTAKKKYGRENTITRQVLVK